MINTSDDTRNRILIGIEYILGFDKLVAKGYADPKMGHTADDVLADEVEKDSEDYKTFSKAGLLVKHKGKFYVGEF